MSISSSAKPFVLDRLESAADQLPDAVIRQEEDQHWFKKRAANWPICPRCSIQNQRLDPNGECRNCNEGAAEREKQEARVRIALGGAKAWLRMTPESFQQTDGNRAAFEAVSQFDCMRDNLYLFGATGTGKTHAAVIAARRVVTAQHTSQVFKTYQILRSVRMKSPDEEQAIIDRLVALPGLVIDDLGVEKSSEYALTILYEIIDRRDMDERNGLIVTSNLRLDALATKMGDDRLPSRLAGMCRVIEIGGKDWRAR